jgi:hypothetical protein
MKKIYLAFTLLLTAVSAGAQQYYPLLDSANTWIYTTNFLPLRQENPVLAASDCSYPQWFGYTMTEYTAADTVIGAFTYKTVESVMDQNPTMCAFGFVREDTAARKVYFLDNAGNPEITLYDFSMQVGDTMSITFNQQGYFLDGLFTLDSITTVFVSAGGRRAFHLNDHANSQNHTLTWIESVGNLADAFYPYSANQQSTGWFWNCSIFPHDNLQFMTCFHHDYRVYYDSCAWQEALNNNCIYAQDTCNYWNICSGIQELPSLSSVTVFPNPAQEGATVTLDVKCEDEFYLLVHDVPGRQVVRRIATGSLAPGQQLVKLDLTGLRDGIYIVEIRSPAGAVFHKLVVQH